MYILFNVVIGEKNNPLAILIRGIYPKIGISLMKGQTIQQKSKNFSTDRPGKLSRAFGIGLKKNGLSLSGDLIWIDDQQTKIYPEEIRKSKRIRSRLCRR